MKWFKWLLFDLMEMALRRHLRLQRGVIAVETNHPGILASMLYTVLAMEIETARDWALAHDA